MGLRIDRKQDKRVVHACTHNLADIPNGVTVCSADLVAGGVLQEGTVLGKDEAGLFHAVKTARVTEAATNAATSYKVAKGHHFKKGDFVMLKVGGKAYAVTGIDEFGRDIFELRPLNPLFPTLSSQTNPLQILGVVVECRTRFR